MVQEMVLVLGKVGKVLLVDVLALFPISFIFLRKWTLVPDVFNVKTKAIFPRQRKE
jgi:hypothetical protein